MCTTDCGSNVRMHTQDAKVLFAAALDNGAVRIRPTQAEWDLSGSCERPVHLNAFSNAQNIMQTQEIFPGWSQPVWHQAHGYNVFMSVRCRKCPSCRRHRRNRWVARAIAECDGSARTWFCTLTAAPEHQFRFQLLAEKAVENAGSRWSDLTGQERFAELCKQMGKEATLMLKRLRNAGAVIRYLLVFEAHKSGAPHIHALIHESSLGVVKKRLLESAWRVGFSQFRLLTDRRQAGYACKYIADGEVRIRASQQYGDDLDHSVSVECACSARRGDRGDVPPAGDEKKSTDRNETSKREAILEPNVCDLSASEMLNLEILTNGLRVYTHVPYGPNLGNAIPSATAHDGVIQGPPIWDSSVPDL